jgi:hypothetical protein
VIVGAPRRTSEGWRLGAVVLGRYGPGSTLAYHELVVFSAVARAGALVGLDVAYIAVDSDASVAGGRQIWGLPKRVADFTWTAAAAVTVVENGVPVLRARVRRRGPRLPLPVLAPFFGRLDGRRVHAVARGRLLAAPALIELEVPADSPIAGLVAGGRRAGLDGTRLDLAVAPARLVRPPAPAASP